MASAAAPSICFVTADFAGAGTPLSMSRLLAARGWSVHVLLCGDVDLRREMPRLTAERGVELRWLADLVAPAGNGSRHYGGDHDTLERSLHVLDALQELHAEHRFDLIEFPARGGLGLHAVQAKRCGIAFDDVSLAVKLHSTTQWEREGTFGVRLTPRHLEIEYAEQYTFEQADVQLSPSASMIDYSRSRDWAVRDDVEIAHPYPDVVGDGAAQGPEIRELAFFGRLDRQDGLDVFLDALDETPDYPVLFMGEDTDVGGRKASELIADRMGDRPFRVETALDRAETIAELLTGDRLAVIASTRETSGFAAAECVANRIPFVAAAAGGVPEAVPDPDAHDRWLFAPTAEGLAAALRRRLDADGTAEASLRTAVARRCDPVACNDAVEATYRSLVGHSGVPLPESSSETATVSVAVAHFNHAAYLPAALSSLAGQTRPADEVFVVDDGSTDPLAIRTFDELEREYPAWTFLRQSNAGPGAARNLALERATGRYFLPFDADNIAAPDMIEHFVSALDRDAALAVVACHTLAFVHEDDIEARRFAFRYAPTGGPRLSALLDNVYGDTGSMFRTEALRDVGGFENERWNPHEDWETMVKLALREHRMQVLPRALFWYRSDHGGRLQTLSANRTLPARHRHYMAERFFADAALTRRERVDLFECLIGFDQLASQDVDEAIRWHQDELHRVLVSSEESIAEVTASRDALVAELGRFRDAGPALRIHGPAGRVSTVDLVAELGRRTGRKLRWWSEKTRRAGRAVSRR